MTLRKWIIDTILLVGLGNGLAMQAAASSPPATTPASGIEQANFDKSVRPQDDLFRAVNGAWLAKTEIPADRSDYGVFGILAEKAENDLREIIEKLCRGQG